MTPRPEDEARTTIDAMLAQSGWLVQDMAQANLHAGQGVAVREFPLKQGHGFADYLLFVNGQAVGVLEAKKVGTTLTGVEVQAEKYATGYPEDLAAPIRPLPFCYQATGVETRFTNLLDPDPCSRLVFAIHRPGTLAEWMSVEPRPGGSQPSTLRSRLQHLPPIPSESGLWGNQISAITKLEQSLALGRPRALIQMATGSGKSLTSAAAVYRMVKHTGAKRVLFLVDRGNLGRQALKEFQNYTCPDTGNLFGNVHVIQQLSSNKINDTAKVVIGTIQRLYSILRGDPEAAIDDEASSFDAASTEVSEPPPVAYSPHLPPEFFDVIIIDECHRSIYSLWRQVLEYFDAFLIGLTATPAKHTFGFFQKNLVMEFGHHEAVASGCNVDYDIYRITTKVTAEGATAAGGPFEVIGARDKLSRQIRWEKQDEDIQYKASQLDRTVVNVDQIRTVIECFRDNLFTEIMPGRSHVPKTLIFAKSDSHADDIVQMVREVFAKGNDFCEKITYNTGTARMVTPAQFDDHGRKVADERIEYRSSGVNTDDLLSAFRNSYHPRIVVTVDMIATGTDVKPLEIVLFMRQVKSRLLFEQMKGRGVRVIPADDLKAVTPDAVAKTHFVLVDAVGIVDTDLIDAVPPVDSQKSVSMEALLKGVAFGTTNADTLSTLAGRLKRLDGRMSDLDRSRLTTMAGGTPPAAIAANILHAIDPNHQHTAAVNAMLSDLEAKGEPIPDTISPSPEQVAAAGARLIAEAVKPIASNPDLRQELLTVKRSTEQIYDNKTIDELVSAEGTKSAMNPSQAEAAKAAGLVASFRDYIEAHKDEITALQVLYNTPSRRALSLDDLEDLAARLSQALPDAVRLRRQGDYDVHPLWQAFAQLEADRVSGKGGRHLLTDLITLVRHAIGQVPNLEPFADQVGLRFDQWLERQQAQGSMFTAEQLAWLAAIRDQIASSLSMEREDFRDDPFSRMGGLGKAKALFGDQLHTLVDELNRELVA
ncbi:MAG: DEAD/DEAH box helicase [Planctomycetota bacterium]|nr:MAG: DEAD/DEAH box helicase [Planctomycetota bacterium]